MMIKYFFRRWLFVRMCMYLVCPSSGKFRAKKQVVSPWRCKNVLIICYRHNTKTKDWRLLVKSFVWNFLRHFISSLENYGYAKARIISTSLWIFSENHICYKNCNNVRKYFWLISNFFLWNFTQENRMGCIYVTLILVSTNSWHFCDLITFGITKDFILRFGVISPSKQPGHCQTNGILKLGKKNLGVLIFTRSFKSGTRVPIEDILAWPMFVLYAHAILRKHPHLLISFVIFNSIIYCLWMMQGKYS